MSQEPTTGGGGQTPPETNATVPPARSGARKAWIALGTVAVLVAGVGAVHAQRWGERPGWGERGDGPGRGEVRRMARIERFCKNDAERYEPAARLFVKADLRLNGDQAAAFDKLADTALPALKELKAEACNNFLAKGGTAPERLQYLSAVLRKASDAAEKSVQPMNDFYAKLDDTQKARVEQVLERRRLAGLIRPFGGMPMEMGWRDGPRPHRWGGGWGGPGGRPPMHDQDDDAVGSGPGAAPARP